MNIILNNMYSLIFFAVYTIATVSAMLVLLRCNQSSSVVLSWLLVLWILPIIGPLFFFSFGTPRKYKNIMSQIPEDDFSLGLAERRIKQEKYVQQWGDIVYHKLVQKLFFIVEKVCKTPVFLSDDVTLHYNGEEHFEAIFQDIKQAKQSILMEYFIWRSDSLGIKIKDLLIKKAQEGVKVYLIFDGLGSFNTISHAYRKELKQNNINYKYFLDLRNPVSRFFINHRTHRKIIVIDEHIGYTGGMNMAQEYIDGGPRFDLWRDTHVRVTGEAAKILASIFKTDWFNSNKERRKRASTGTDFKLAQEKNGLFIHSVDKKNANLISNLTKGKVLSHVVFGGPDSTWSAMENVILTAIHGAEKHIRIQSPYFVPTRTLTNALVNAALIGVKIEFMMTGIPDKRIPFWAAETYFPQLLNAGIKIYQYKKGFLHSKTLTIDGMVSLVGTCNLDERSLKLNYEVAILFYNEKIAKNLSKQFDIDKEDCIILAQNQEIKLYNLKWLRNAISNLFAPLL